MVALTIEVYSDITCPWCFIGTRRLGDVLATLAPGTETDVSHRPFLLNPDIPPEGLDLTDHLAGKYGRNPRELFRMVEVAAERGGLELDLSRQPRTYPTVAAHTVLRHAAARGTARALLDALFTAYFHEGRNIADADVLVDVAAAHAFEADETRRLVGDMRELDTTRREAEDAVALGIRSVPHFVFGGALSFSGAQSREVFEAAVQQALAA